MEMIIFISAISYVILCVACAIYYIVLKRYRDEKQALMDELENAQPEVWKGEVLEGEQVELGRTPGKKGRRTSKGYGQGVFDFYGQDQDGVVEAEEVKGENDSPTRSKINKVHAQKGKADVDSDEEVDPFERNHSTTGLIGPKSKRYAKASKE